MLRRRSGCGGHRARRSSKSATNNNNWLVFLLSLSPFLGSAAKSEQKGQVFFLFFVHPEGFSAIFWDPPLANCTVLRTEKRREQGGERECEQA